MLNKINITIGRYWAWSGIHEKQKKSRIPSHPTKNCSPPLFSLENKVWAPSFGTSKKLPAPFFFFKKTSCPLFFPEKNSSPPFSLLQRNSSPPIILLKKSRRPPVDKPGPGTPNILDAPLRLHAFFYKHHRYKHRQPEIWPKNKHHPSTSPTSLQLPHTNFAVQLLMIFQIW